MGNSQSPLHLTRWLVGGAVLAVLGIGLFLLIYFTLPGMDAMPRLLLALCVPPLVMSLLLGGYILAAGTLTPKE